MAISLETVVLELKANDKQLKQDINTSVSNAKQQLQKLENVPISLDVDISPIKKRINELNKKGISIDVDHSPLVELNDHLDKKKQHLTLLQAYFNSKPLTPSVNFDQLKSLENEFNNLKSEHDKLRGHFDSKPLTPVVDVSNLQQLINQLNNLLAEYNNTQNYINSNSLTPTVDIENIKKLVNKLNNLLAEYDGTQQHFDSNALTPAIDVKNLERLINQLNNVIENYDGAQKHFNANPLTPTIDIKGLEQLVNELHNVIKEHNATQQHFNANPLTPTINTINLQQLVNEFHGVITEHDATQEHFDANPLTPKADTSEIERIINNLNELENHNNKTIELNFDAAANIGVEEFTEAIQQGAYEGTQEAQGGEGIFGRIDDIITGTFEGFGEEVSKDFYKGFSNNFRNRVTKSGSATEKYVGSRGKKIGKSLITNVGNYVGVDDFLKDIDVVGNAIDDFLDPQQFSKRLKNFEDNIVRSLENIYLSSQIQPLSSKTASHRNVKALPQQPLQEALDGDNSKEARKYLIKAFTPPTEPIRKAATRAAGVGIKAASQPFRIRKRVKLAESMQEIERKRDNAEVFPEGIAKDAKSLTLSMGGIDFQKGAPNSDFSHNLANKILPGTASKPVYNTEAQKLSGKEWTVQIRRVLGELRSEGDSQIKEQLSVVERIVEGLQGFVQGLDEQTKQQTHKAPENPLLQRVYAGMQRSGMVGMSKQEVDEVTAATPVDKIIEAAIQTGSYPDAVNIAAEIAANKEKYPDMPMNVTGSSGGGYIVEEVVALLERMGYTGVKGIGLMSAPVGNTRTASAENYRSYIGTGDYVAHATYGKRPIEDKDTDYAVGKALQATFDEYPFLKYFEGLFSPDPETTKIMAGSGIEHQLPTTLADSELAPDLEKFTKQGKISEDFKDVQAKTEIKEKGDISLSDIKKYIVQELGVGSEKEIKTGLQEIYQNLNKREPLKKFLDSEYGRKEKERNSNIENIDLREKDTLYKIYEKIAETKVQNNKTRGTKNFEFFRLMKDDFEGSFAPLAKSILASLRDPEALNQITPGEIQAANTQNTPHSNVKQSPQQPSLQETLFPPFSFVEYGLNEDEQKQKINAIEKGGLKNVKKKANRTSGEVKKYAERYLEFLRTFAEELREFYKSGEPLIHSLQRAQNIGEFKQEKTPVFSSLKDYTPQSPEQQANLKFLQDEERDVEAIRRSIGASFVDPTSLQEIAQGEFTFADPRQQDPDKLRIFDELLQHKEYLQGQVSGKIREHGEEYLKFIRQFREELAAFHFGDDRHPTGKSLAELKELKEPKRDAPLSPEAKEISISQWRTMGENVDTKSPIQGGRSLEGVSNEQLVDIMQNRNKTLDEMTDEEKNKIKNELNEIATKAKTGNQEQLQKELEKQRKPKKQKGKSKNNQWQVTGKYVDTKSPIQSGKRPVGLSNEEFLDFIQKPKNKEKAEEALVEKLVNKLTEQLQKIIDGNKEQWQAVESQYKTIESQYELIQQEIKEVRKVLQPEVSGGPETSSSSKASGESNNKNTSESQNQQQSESNDKQSKNQQPENQQPESKQQQTESTEKHKQSETAASASTDPEEIKQKIKDIEKNFEEPYQRFLEELLKGNIKFAKHYAETFESAGKKAKEEIDAVAQQYKELTGDKGIQPGSVGQTQGSTKGRITNKEKYVKRNLKKEQQRLQREANEQRKELKKNVSPEAVAKIDLLKKNKELIKGHWDETKRFIIEGLKQLSSESEEQGYKIQKNISEGSPGITQKIRKYWKATTNSIKTNINTLENRASEFAQSTKSVVGNSFESLKNKTNNFAKSTKASIESLQSKVQNFSQGLRSAVAGAHQQLNDRANEFRESINNNIGTLQNKVQNFSQGLRSAVAGGVAQVRGPQNQQQNQQQNQNKRQNQVYNLQKPVQNQVHNLKNLIQNQIDNPLQPNPLRPNNSTGSQSTIENMPTIIAPPPPISSWEKFNNQIKNFAKSTKGYVESLQNKVQNFSQGRTPNMMRRVSIQEKPVQNQVHNLQNLIQNQANNPLQPNPLHTASQSTMPTLMAPQPTSLRQKLKNQIKNFKQSTTSFAQGLNNQINNFAQSTRNAVNNINPLGPDNDDENIFAGIKEKLKNFDASQFIGDALLTLGTVEGFQALSEQITTLGRSAIDAFLKMERLKIGLSFSNTNVEKTLESIKNETDRLGISFINAAKGYKSFSSATKGTNLENQTQDIFSGFTQSISAMQLGAERQKRVYTAISQIASKGVVSTEELRLQLGEQLPVAFNAAARAMGMTVKEFNKLVSSGNVLSEDLLPKLAQQLQIETRETAKKSIGTLTFELQKLKNTIFEMQASTGKELAAFITPVVSNMNELINLIKNNSDLFISLSASLLAVGSVRVLTRFTALASHFVDLNTLAKKLIRQLPNIKKGLKPIGKSIKTFGIQVAALAGAIAAVRLAWKQAHLHETEFDKGAANVADTLREVNNELGNTSDKLDQIGQKEFKLEGMQGWLDEAIAGLDWLDDKASGIVAKISLPNKEFLRTELSTGAEAKASHMKIDATRQNNTRSQLIYTFENQIYSNEIMDNMVSELKENNQKQKAVEAALISVEGDTAKEEELRKRQKELLEARKQIITNTIPGGKQTIKEQIKAVEGQIDRMRELDGSELPNGEVLDFSPHIQRSEQQLESLQNALDEFNIHLEMASREANVLANQFEKIDSSFENKTFNISTQETQAKQQVHKGFLQGDLNKEQYEQELNKIELRHQQTRLQNLRKYQEKYKNVFEDLNQVDRASLKNLLDGKKIEKAGMGDLTQAKETAKEGDVSSNVKAALDRAIQIRNRTQEIESLENQILKTRIQQREESGGIKDASEKIRDEMQKLKEARKQHQEKQKKLVSQNKDLVEESDKFGQSIRDFIRSTKEQLINIRKQIKDTKKENAKLSIKNELSAIGGEVSSLFGSFEEVFTDSVAAQEKFDTTEEQKALTRMEAEQKTINIARKIKDFQDQRKEIVKRGNELRKKYLENERKYEKIKAERWRAILKQHKKVQDQVGAIGKGMHKTAKGIIDQGNNLLKALHTVANRVNNTNFGGGSTGNIGNIGDIGEALFKAIIGKESSGNHKAVNPDTGALGLGQVLPSNVASWTKQALGESLSPQEFLNDKQAQINTIEHKLAQYYSEALEKAGGNQEEAIRRVASKWYSGQGRLFDADTDEGDYPSIRDYTLDILDRIKNNAGSKLGGAVGNITEKAKQFVQNNTTTNDNKVEDAVNQVMSQLQNQASQITFPVPGQGANDNLVGPGGMMDSYRNRGPGRPNRHNGIDYAYATGTQLQAPVSGTVQSVYSDKGEYGVRIKGKNEEGESVVVALNHLHSITENLKQGAQIQAGQKIGTVGGDQGSWGSTGAHLDLKVKVNGQYIDPRNFFGNTKGAVTNQVSSQTQQQAKAQISDFEPISLDTEEPVDTSTNIPEFSPINPRSLNDLPEFKNKISDNQQELSEAEQENIEAKRRQQELQIKNKIEKIQTQIRDKVRETKHETSKSREEMQGLIRNSGTVLTTEQKILEEREEISSNFDDAIRQRTNEIRQGERQLEAEKERLKVMQERVENLEDGDRKTQLQETIKLMKQNINVQEEQINSTKEEIRLLGDRKPKAIKENIELKRRELELQSRSFKTGLETEVLDTQKGLLSAQDGSLYKQAEIQKESALMQERLSHAEKILEIEQTIKDEQRQQELINLANQAHENRIAQIEAEKQQQIEEANRKKQTFSGNMQADLLQAQAKATEFNPYRQAELEGEAKLIQHKLDTSQRKKELEEQIKLLDLNTKEAGKLRNQFQQLNQLKLNRIKEESNLLGQQIKNIAQKGFSTLFDSFAKVVRGTKSMGEAFRDFGLTVLKQISKIATKNLTNAVMGGIFGGGGNKAAATNSGSTGGGILGSVAGGIFGGGGGGGIGSTIGSVVSGLFYKGGTVPNFAHGGEVDKAFGDGVGNIEDYVESENIDDIRNFATGGLIDAVKKEKAAGGKPVPIVASAGEQILSTQNGDAQFFREIQKKGLWEEIKNGTIGALGNIKDMVGGEQPVSKIENYNTGGIVNNKNLSTNNIANNSIKNKMDWAKPSFDARALRSKTDWATQPMVSTSRNFESTQKAQSSNMRGETSLNINTPITVVAPKPEAYRKSAKQIAGEQERQTQRAYKRFS